MTTPDELDRVISHVAGELTRANTDGFGERVQGRLRARASASQAGIAWWRWPAVTATAATAAIVFAVVTSRQMPRTPANPTPARGSAPIAADKPLNAAPSDVTVMAAAPREGPRATRARAARPAPRAMSPAEVAWLARAVPPLPDAAPVEVPEFGITSIAPRNVDLPPLVIEPLGPRDINK